MTELDESVSAAELKAFLLQHAGIAPSTVLLPPMPFIETEAAQILRRALLNYGAVRAFHEHAAPRAQPAEGGAPVVLNVASWP